MTEGAVLFADLQMDALYDALEEGVVTALIGSATAQLGEAVFACGGRVVKVIGAEVLAVFPDVPEAAEAAIAMQRHRATRPLEGPGVGALCIGIAWGPLTERDGDVFGDTVSIAARLQSFARASALPIVLSGESVARLRPGQPAARQVHAIDVKGRQIRIELYALP